MFSKFFKSKKNRPSKVVALDKKSLQNLAGGLDTSISSVDGEPIGGIIVKGGKNDYATFETP